MIGASAFVGTSCIRLVNDSILRWFWFVRKSLEFTSTNVPGAGQELHTTSNGGVGRVHIHAVAAAGPRHG